ncbi:Putative metal-dependent hydrolase [Thioalkalivibrio nitratireducens DSM 14787]|uniref:Endoribonuclease YbeY n=1 Tax=Thioalkalivibrio nitratireducens (strain DSM 14787 / UNIQEM 213 / ALEN2) TaxID=1255043 RepID=L0DYQ5_THIND|nr:Putative metal-dependent hydrolase [Thioalkalivibrio nitratireducens DSM 14787]
MQAQYALGRAGWPAPATLHRAARAAWRGSGPAQVTLRVVDADEGRALNQAFRGRARATNVLSFPALGANPGYLGDIVLCAPVLADEAREQHKSLAAHFAHMVVHGMLHLQGMEHERAAEAEAMEAIEREILAGLGYPDPYAEPA